MIEFDLGFQKAHKTLNPSLSLASISTTLKISLKLSNEDLYFFCENQLLQLDTPLITQVEDNATIQVCLKRFCNIQWKDKVERIQYFTNITSQSLIDQAKEVFAISVDSNSLCLKVGEKSFNCSSFIPFQGFGDATILLQQSSNIVINSSMNTITIQCEDETPQEYEYDSMNSIGFYFDKALTDYDLTDLKDDLCITDCDNLLLPLRKTLKQLDIQPNDVLYLKDKEEAITIRNISIITEKGVKNYPYRPRNTVECYMTLALENSGISVSRGILESYSLSVENSNISLPLDKTLGELGIQPTVILHLKRTSVLSILYESNHFTFPYDLNMTLTDYIKMVFEATGMTFNSLRLKKYVFVLANSDYLLPFDKSLVELGIQPFSTLVLKKRTPTISVVYENSIKSYDYIPSQSVEYYLRKALEDNGMRVNGIRLKLYHLILETDHSVLPLSQTLEELSIQQSSILRLEKKSSDVNSSVVNPLPVNHPPPPPPADPPVAPKIPPPPIKHRISIQNLTNLRKESSLINPSNLTDVIKNMAGSICEEYRKNPSSCLLFDEAGSVVKRDAIKCESSFNLYIIPKSFISFPNFESESVSISGSILDVITKPDSVLKLIIDWKSSKLDSSRLTTLLKNNSIFKCLKTIFISDGISLCQGSADFHYTGNRASLSYDSVSFPYSLLQNKGVNDLLSILFKKLKMTVKIVISIDRDDNRIKRDTLEHDCKVFQQTNQLAKDIIEFTNPSTPAPLPGPHSPVPEMNQLEFFIDDFNSFDDGVVEYDSGDNRSYLSDESILIGKVSKDLEIDNLNFTSMKVYYEGSEYISLPSALTDGMDHIQKDSHISYSGVPKLQKQPIQFILPLLPHDNKGNIIPDTIYFYCLQGVKDCSLGFLCDDGKTVLSNYCDTNILILHSSQPSIKVIQARSEDRSNWKFIKVTPYREVSSSTEGFPYLKKTPQTEKRDKVVEDVIQFDQPTIIEGVTSSGKTYTVEQYCMRAQLPLVRYNFSPSSTIEELIGDMVIDKDGNICYKDGPFTEAFIKGKILLLDEMSLAPSTIIQSLLSYLLGKKLLYEAGETNEERAVHPFFRVIATQNPAGSSYKRSNLSASIRDCFRFVTHTTTVRTFPSIEKEELQDIITGIFNNDTYASRLVADAHDIANRKKYISRSIIDQGKDYTLRDCSRAKAIMKSCENLGNRRSNSVEHAIAITYNNPLKQFLLTTPAISFNEDSIDAQCWKNVYERMHFGLQSGCHILLIGKTEYTARKYCHSYLSSIDQPTNFIHCTSSSSSEGIIGVYGIDSSGNPQFVKSGLLEAIENGGIAVLQNLELMKSNVIERMNSVLEIVPTDGFTHELRFDEIRDQSPLITMDSNFRIIATASEKGLMNFSPALRNRFLEVFIGDEDSKNMNSKVSEIDWNSLDEGTVVDSSTRNSIDAFVSKTANNPFTRNAIRRAMICINHLSKNLELSKDLCKQLEGKEKLPFEIKKSLPLEFMRELFFSLTMNKATAIHGPKSCGKTYTIRELLSTLEIDNKYYIHVSNETEYSTLMGSVDIQGNFNPGLLYNAAENGYLVVFENAENMSNELIEMLDCLVDPFTHSTSYHSGEEFTIHPAFRVLLVFTNDRPTFSTHLPAYYKVISFPEFTSSRLKTIVPSEPIWNLLCESVDKGDISINDVLIIHSITKKNKTFSVIEVFACLFAERRNKHEFINSFIESCRNKKIITDDDEMQSVDIILQTQNVSVTKDSHGNALLSRGRIRVSSTIPFSDIENKDRSIQVAVFTALLTGYKSSGRPLLLVGDSEITSVVSDLLEKNATKMELSRSMEMVHSFGEISICKKEDIEYILTSSRFYPAEANPLSILREYLIKKTDEIDDDNLLIFRPGPVLLAAMSGVPLVIKHINQLNDRLLPRFYGLLSNLGTDDFTLFEDNSNVVDSVVAGGFRAIATTEYNDYMSTQRKDIFIQVFCQDFSEEEYSKFKFDNVLKSKYSLSTLRKAIKVSNAFIEPTIHAPLYLHYLESDTTARLDYQLELSSKKDVSELLEFLSLPQTIDSTKSEDINSKIMVQNIHNYKHLFKESILDKVQNSLYTSKHDLLPTKTTVQLLLSIVIADEVHLPIILEGDPGVGKTAACENYMIMSNIDYKRINFSNNITIDSLFGCYTLVDGKFQFKNGSITDLLFKTSSGRKALLLDEVNLAPCDVLEELYKFINAYINHTRFRIPGHDEVVIPEDMLICCCMNPAFMSANRSSLPRQFYSSCIYHRDLQYSLWELIVTAKSILDAVIHDNNMENLAAEKNSVAKSSKNIIEETILQLFRYTLEAQQKTSIPFSLRDVLKVQQICSDGEDLSLESALWLVFASRYEEDERKEIEKILKLKDDYQISIEREEACCKVNGFCTIDTNTLYSGSFKQWCFTSSELLSMFKLCLALKSKRAMLIYGPSPSGKSYVISKVAEMYDRTCRTVYLNHESTPEVFIGRCSLSTKEGKQDISFRDGPLLKALENGDWVVIEDVHLANSDVMEVLNSLCEENPVLKVMKGNKEVTYAKDPEEGQIRINPNFRLFLTISETTLKNITGPFKSRCVILFFNSIANAQSIQEICNITESTCNPCYFGNEEAQSFRRCCRVINSKEEDAFKIEFEREPALRAYVAKNEVVHSIEYDLDVISDQFEEKRIDMEKLISTIKRIVNSSPRSYDVHIVSQHLRNFKRHLSEHFIYYIINVIDILLGKTDLINAPLTRQNDEYSIILDRWSILNTISPPIEKGKSAELLVQNKEISLKEVFSIDEQDSYQLILVYFILNRTEQYLYVFDDTDLKSVFYESFMCMSGMQTADNIISLTRDLQELVFLYRRLNKTNSIKNVKSAVYSKVKEDEDRFKELCKRLPSSVESLSSFKNVKQSVTEFVSKVTEAYRKFIADSDEEENKRLIFEDAKVFAAGHREFLSQLEEAYEGKMDKNSFNSLKLTVEDGGYKPYVYKSEEDVFIKASHLLYKLKTFKCSYIILSEYSDVLQKIDLDIHCILKHPVYDKVKESLFILLNCLMLNTSFDWRSILADYHSYPFQMPSSLADEDQFNSAVDQLIDYGWYESYVKECESTSEETKMYEKLKEKLRVLFHHSDAVRPISLVSPILLQAVDDCDYDTVEKYPYDQIVKLQGTWRIHSESVIKEGSIVPQFIMKMEYDLSSRSILTTDVLLANVWDITCKLPIREKLQVICPRRRTPLGQVVIDMLNSKDLREVTLIELKNADSIDDLVKKCVESLKLYANNKLAQLNLRLSENISCIQHKQDDLKQYESKMIQLRNEIINYYTNLINQQNNQSSYRNDNTISFWSYLLAVNAIEDTFVDMYAKKNKLEKDFADRLNEKYIPFSFQIIWISKNDVDFSSFPDLSVVFYPPAGLEKYIYNNQITISLRDLHPLYYGNGYLIVLPLAPFMWNIQCNVNYKVFSYYNHLHSLSKDKASKPTLQLLKNMIHYRDRFNLRYRIIPISINSLYSYARYHPAGNSDPSLAVGRNFVYCYSSDYSAYRMKCNHIESLDDLCDFGIVNFQSRRQVNLKDYISIDSYHFSAIYCYSGEEIPAIHDYNELLRAYSTCKNDCLKLEREKSDIYKETEFLQKDTTSFSQYFFPQLVSTGKGTRIGKSLNNVIVVLKFDSVINIILPSSGIYKLPESIIGVDGNKISIPYMIIGDDLFLHIESSDCEVGVIGGDIELEMRDDTEGTKRVILKAKVTGKDNTVLVMKDIIVEYERKKIRGYIKTSKECSILESGGWVKKKSYTLQAPSFPIKVYYNGKWKEYTDSYRGYYSGYSSQVLSGTDIKIVDYEQSNALKSREFVYSGSDLRIYHKEATSNIVTLSTGSYRTDSSITLEMIKSDSISALLESFNNLALTLLQAGERDKQEIISFLNSCCSSLYLLPSIKNRAIKILGSITNSTSSLSWSDASDTTTNYERIERPGNPIPSPGTGHIDKIINISEKPETPSKTPKTKLTSSVIFSDVGELFRGVVYDPYQQKAKDMEKMKKEDEEYDKTRDELNQNQQDYKPVDYSVYLKMMENEKMDSLYLSIKERKDDIQFISPRSHSETMSQISIRDHSIPIDPKLREYVFYCASFIMYQLSHDNLLKYLPNHLSIVVDMNYTHRKNKARRRSLVTSILICTLMHLDIPFDLYLSISRCRGCHIETKNCSLDKILSFIFDIEGIVKVPSTPLDLLTVDKCIPSTDMTVFISDGFSEQFISKHKDIINFFDKRGNNLFLLCIKGVKEEALSPDKQSELEKSLSSNFSKNVLIIDSITNFCKSIELLQRILFTNKIKSDNKDCRVIPVDSKCEFRENLSVKFEENYSIVQVHSVSSNQQRPKMITILDDELDQIPSVVSDRSIVEQFNTYIKGDNLFDALSINLFIPNKSTAFVPATSGSAIHIPSYIKYLITKTGDGKFFKKLGSQKVRSYNCSIVIDCSTLAFAEINHLHSILTVFTILRNISTLQLPCVDIWIARESIIRVAAGVSSMDLWEDNIIYALYCSLQKPVSQTCLAECILKACCTSRARSFSSVMLVLTNGVSCEESRNAIQSIVTSIEMTYVGIGLGIFLNNFDSLFPTMLWHSNPARLSETLMSMTTSSKNNIKFAVKERMLGDVIDIDGKYGNTEAEKAIESIPSLLEMMIQNIRVVDATKQDGFDSMDFSSNQFDLGPDGGFTEYTILFVLLYLCRNEKRRDGSVIDPDITYNCFRYGNEKNKRRMSPYLKLGDYKVEGHQYGKCFNILYATDYETAINYLHTKKISVMFITCSPGDGVFPGVDSSSYKKEYLNSFLENIHYFNEHGGGVFWFLENYPFTYEADMYFMKYYGFDLVDKEIEVKGGNFMNRDKNPNPSKGHFRTIGGVDRDIRHYGSLDFGIERIFEGRTLCAMNESALKRKGFTVFARENMGYASIVVKEDEGTNGRMIIDTAASKLFMEFSEDGTARWISNAAVWLSKTESYNINKAMDNSYKPGVDMSGMTNYLVRKPFVVREDALQKTVNFCLTVIMDTTGSMSSYIAATKENIKSIFKKVETIRDENKWGSGGIVGQVVQYKDFCDDPIDDDEYITDNFDRLERKLSTFRASGGGDNCEDIQDGFERALKQITKSEYRDYYHLILVCADAPNHPHDHCSYDHNKRNGYSFDYVWDNIIVKELKTLPNYKLVFMPVGNKSLEPTYKDLKKRLPDNVEMSEMSEVTSDRDTFSSLLSSIVTTTYREIGIS